MNLNLVARGFQEDDVRIFCFASYQNVSETNSAYFHICIDHEFDLEILTDEHVSGNQKAGTRAG